MVSDTRYIFVLESLRERARPLERQKSIGHAGKLDAFENHVSRFYSCIYVSLTSVFF
jgi:hypothetical protein